MPANVESLAYRSEGGVPWHGEGVPVTNDMSVDDMLKVSGLDWTVSKRPMYFPMQTPDGKTKLRIVPDEYAYVRDSDESVLDTVGSVFKPVQNHEIFDFFRRFVVAGDMEMETAGSLKGGKFIWALARIKDGSFTLNKNDTTNSYMLLSQPHQFGYALTAALTSVRVVCWNTISHALGAKLDGSGGSNSVSFRMTHAHAFDAEIKSAAERTLGLAHDGIKAYSHTAEMLSQSKATDDAVTDYFYDVLKIEATDEEKVEAEAEENENRRLKRFRESLLSAPGQDLKSAKGTWFGALNAVTFSVDHLIGRDENRLHAAWYGRGSVIKRRALELAVEYAKV